MLTPSSPSICDGSRIVTRCPACASVSHREAANPRADDYDVEAEGGATSTVDRGECFVVGAWERKRGFKLGADTICSDLRMELSRSDLGSEFKSEGKIKEGRDRGDPRTRERKTQRE